MIKKLNNNRGASLVFALFLFVIMSGISIVIVSSYFSASKVMKDDYAHNQNELTMASAVNLVKNEMKGFKANSTDVLSDAQGNPLGGYFSSDISSKLENQNNEDYVSDEYVIKVENIREINDVVITMEIPNHNQYIKFNLYLMKPSYNINNYLSDSIMETKIIYTRLENSEWTCQVMEDQ